MRLSKAGKYLRGERGEAGRGQICENRRVTALVTSVSRAHLIRYLSLSPCNLGRRWPAVRIAALLSHGVSLTYQLRHAQGLFTSFGDR